MNYDASYLSRIRSGKRSPAKQGEFAQKIAAYVVRHFQSDAEKAEVARLLECDVAALNDKSTYAQAISSWLMTAEHAHESYLDDFLQELDTFDLNEYISAIHFDELKVPSVPFQLPLSKSYFNLEGMMDAELAFLKSTVLSKSSEPVIMHSDMPIEEMAKDPEFPKKWMFGMGMMLKKRLKLCQIHNVDRSLKEMMLGLESWIPMYMTGQVSPYYLNAQQKAPFRIC